MTAPATALRLTVIRYAPATVSTALSVPPGPERRFLGRNAAWFGKPRTSQTSTSPGSASVSHSPIDVSAVGLVGLDGLGAFGVPIHVDSGDARLSFKSPSSNRRETMRCVFLPTHPTQPNHRPLFYSFSSLLVQNINKERVSLGHRASPFGLGGGLGAKWPPKPNRGLGDWQREKQPGLECGGVEYPIGAFAGIESRLS